MILKIKDTFEDDLKMILNDHDRDSRLSHIEISTFFRQVKIFDTSNFKVIILKSLRVPLKVFGNFVAKIFKNSTAVILSRVQSEQFN